MILVLDNYDSFTYNLVQYLGELGASPRVVRNDAMSLEELACLEPRGVVISPGPGHPVDAGVSVELVRLLGPRVPLLGVCLGHQAIAAAWGGQVVPAPELVHGKAYPVHHRGQGLFRDLPPDFPATRYHSLVVDPDSLPPGLEVTAWTSDGTCMGLAHREHPVFGVQFHPESILTGVGKQLLENYLGYCRGQPPATPEPGSHR